MQVLDSIVFIKSVNVERLLTQLKDLMEHIPEINNAGIPLLNVIKQLFKDNKTDMPLQLIADIKNFESKNDFEGIKTAIEQYINSLPLTNKLK
jgi:hypothetical protein